MEDYNQDQEYLNMTVRCILCRGTIIYKDGDITRFSAHLANEHGAFFDVEYLLASCFMDDNQKDAISQSIRTNSPPVMQTLPPPNEMQTFDPSEMDPTPASAMDIEQPSNQDDVFKASMKQSGRACCDLCPKSYTRNEGLKKHILKAHSGSAPAEIATEKNPQQDMEEAEQSLTESIEESFSSTADQAEQSFNAAADNLLSELDKELEELDKDNINMEEAEESTIKTEDTADDTTEEKAEKKKGEKKYECQICGKVYNSQQGLAYHLKKSSCSENPDKEVTEKVPTKKRDEGELNEVLLGEGIDVSKSAYFSKTKQGLTMAVSSTIEKFTETLPFLPEGWKYRTSEQKDKGKVVIHKHYLSPANVLVKASMAVVEYLRLEGKLNPEEILDVAKSLRVGPVKLKKLFANDASDISVNDETVTEAAA